ncbi:MAG: hypothetical protein OXU20_26770 [Myxococcales bacterium]|nr:hypothetical protein [Myxococcales bacterium]
MHSSTCSASRRRARLPLLAMVLLSACGDDDHRAPTKKATEAPTEVVNYEDMTPSQRLLGHWTLDLSKIPKGSLGKNLQGLRERGLDDKMEVEYVFTASEFILNKQGAGGPVERRWTYQVIQEGEDTVVLERFTEEGDRQTIVALVTAQELQLGRGKDQVMLKRKP